jgi:ParB-like chromosome segregation protein Spo0J
LKSLHAESTLSHGKIEIFSRLSDSELIESLKPGQPGALKTRPDGTVIDGHHRLKVLKDRGIVVDDLPRDVIPKE